MLQTSVFPFRISPIIATLYRTVYNLAPTRFLNLSSVSFSLTYYATVTQSSLLFLDCPKYYYYLRAFAVFFLILLWLILSHHSSLWSDIASPKWWSLILACKIALAFPLFTPLPCCIPQNTCHNFVYCLYSSLSLSFEKRNVALFNAYS